MASLLASGHILANHPDNPSWREPRRALGSAEAADISEHKPESFDVSGQSVAGIQLLSKTSVMAT